MSSEQKGFLLGLVCFIYKWASEFGILHHIEAKCNASVFVLHIQGQISVVSVCP